MFWKKIKDKIKNAINVVKAFDDCVFNYGKNDDCDVDIAMARHNYEAYQNDLKQRSQDLIKKWNKKIIEASSRGEKFFMTKQFITDDGKDKILRVFNEANRACDFPADATLQYFQQYYENKGFKVIKIQYQNNICCLKIIWIPSDSN